MKKLHWDDTFIDWLITVAADCLIAVGSFVIWLVDGDEPPTE
jgi:hypothetical protein